MAGAVGLTAVVTAAVAGIAVARHDRATVPAALTSTSPSAAERSPGSGLNELETCYALIPLLSASAKDVNAVVDHPGDMPADLTSTIAGFRSLQTTAPEGWRRDIGIQADSLQQLYDAHGDHGKIAALDSSRYADAGIRLAHGCLPYAVVSS